MVGGWCAQRATRVLLVWTCYVPPCLLHARPDNAAPFPWGPLWRLMLVPFYQAANGVYQRLVCTTLVALRQQFCWHLNGDCVNYHFDCIRGQLSPSASRGRCRPLAHERQALFVGHCRSHAVNRKAVVLQALFVGHCRSCCRPL